MGKIMQIGRFIYGQVLANGHVLAHCSDPWPWARTCQLHVARTRSWMNLHLSKKLHINELAHQKIMVRGWYVALLKVMARNWYVAVLDAKDKSRGLRANWTLLEPIVERLSNRVQWCPIIKKNMKNHCHLVNIAFVNLWLTIMFKGFRRLGMRQKAKQKERRHLDTSSSGLTLPNTQTHDFIIFQHF